MASRGKSSGKRTGKSRGKGAQARFKADRLKATGGILADLNKSTSPAKTLLGGVGKDDMDADADAVLAAPEPATEAPAAAPEAPPAEAATDTAPATAKDATDAAEVPEATGAAETAEAAEASPAAPADGARAGSVEVPSGLDALLDTVSREGLQPKAPEPLPGEEDIPVHIDRPLRVPLESYVKVVKGERVARALARDISENGIYLAAMALPMVVAGDEVRLEVTLPDAEPIWVQGKAVRDLTDKGFHALAIHFQNLAGGDREAIRAYVAARADRGR